MWWFILLFLCRKFTFNHSSYEEDFPSVPKEEEPDDLIDIPKELYSDSEIKKGIGSDSSYAYPVKVYKVIDGDTFKVKMTDKSNIFTVRLWGIDCPETYEPAQKFGKEATKFVKEIIEGKKVIIEWKKGMDEDDEYGRRLCIVRIGSININEELLKNGLAWVCDKYCKDNHYYDLQKEAEEKKLNIWSDTHPIAPWLWRKEHSINNTHKHYLSRERHYNKVYQLSIIEQKFPSHIS